MAVIYTEHTHAYNLYHEWNFMLQVETESASKYFTSLWPVEIEDELLSISECDKLASY